MIGFALIWNSVTDYAEAQQLILTIQSKGLKTFVRVGENNTRIIKRVCDAGADGISSLVSTLLKKQKRRNKQSNILVKAKEE